MQPVCPNTLLTLSYRLHSPPPIPFPRRPVAKPPPRTSASPSRARAPSKGRAKNAPLESAAVLASLDAMSTGAEEEDVEDGMGTTAPAAVPAHALSRGGGSLGSPPRKRTEVGNIGGSPPKRIKPEENLAAASAGNSPLPALEALAPPPLLARPPPPASASTSRAVAAAAAEAASSAHGTGLASALRMRSFATAAAMATSSAHSDGAAAAAAAAPVSARAPYALTLPPPRARFDFEDAMDVDALADGIGGLRASESMDPAPLMGIRRIEWLPPRGGLRASAAAAAAATSTEGESYVPLTRSERSALMRLRTSRGGGGGLGAAASAASDDDDALPALAFVAGPGLVAVRTHDTLRTPLSMH